MRYKHEFKGMGWVRLPGDRKGAARVGLQGDSAYGATSDRKGREGASPSSTPRRIDIPRTLFRRRCVDDGFTPSRPLRSLVALSPIVPLSSPLSGDAPPHDKNRRDGSRVD